MLTIKIVSGRTPAISAMRTAHAFRKAAAIEYNCKPRDISWRECLLEAWALVKETPFDLASATTQMVQKAFEERLAPLKEGYKEDNAAYFIAGLEILFVGATKVRSKILTSHAKPENATALKERVDSLVDCWMAVSHKDILINQNMLFSSANLPKMSLDQAIKQAKEFFNQPSYAKNLWSF